MTINDGGNGRDNYGIIGDVSPPIILKTPFAGSFVIPPENGLVQINATDRAGRVELPAADTESVFEIVIQKLDKTNNFIWIDPAIGDTINGPTGPIGSQFRSVTLVTDGVSTWNVIDTRP